VSDGVKEGQPVVHRFSDRAGLFPATHRGIVSSITPIAIPQRRLGRTRSKDDSSPDSLDFPVDATAYPVTAAAPFDPATGEVRVTHGVRQGTKETALTNQRITSDSISSCRTQQKAR
jgi:hypothetical protein